VRGYGPPVLDTFSRVDVTTLQRSAGETIPPRAHGAATGEWLGELDEATLEGLARAHRQAPSPLSAIVLVQMGGAVGEVPAGETAFAFRHAKHALEVLADWAGGEDPGPHLEWMGGVRAGVSSSSLGAGYVNFLGQEGEERVRAAYGPASYRRLAAVKRAVDPANRFRCAPRSRFRCDGRAGGVAQMRAPEVDADVPRGSRASIVAALAAVAAAFWVGDPHAVQADVALGAARGRVADPEADQDRVAVERRSNDSGTARRKILRSLQSR
jgi:hypothetical protein